MTDFADAYYGGGTKRPGHVLKKGHPEGGGLGEGVEGVEVYAVEEADGGRS